MRNILKKEHIQWIVMCRQLSISKLLSLSYRRDYIDMGQCKYRQPASIVKVLRAKRWNRYGLYPLDSRRIHHFISLVNMRESMISHPRDNLYPFGYSNVPFHLKAS